MLPGDPSPCQLRKLHGNLRFFSPRLQAGLGPGCFQMWATSAPEGARVWGWLGRGSGGGGVPPT